ncbi:hypothetical protein [Streptomyces decoyicus]|uniref:hypothetical protein n=1 Tax=Streptomyces decoyicus TaxID=249567 RepID=UPI002E1984B1|nr:hypothetical protein OG532_00965 [Streptomyces decoyicus]
MSEQPEQGQDLMGRRDAAHGGRGLAYGGVGAAEIAGRTESATQPLAELATVTEACDRLDDAVTSEKDRWVTAQRVATETRRRQCPGRTTWAPTDQEKPVPAPAEVVDGEGEVWTRTGNGTWYMLSFNPATCEDERDADYLTWRELVDEYGPLTSHERTM